MTGPDQTPPSGPEDDHRRLREMLGAFVLEQLTVRESSAVRAHLDGCPDCRAELADIAPLVADLRMVDAARLDSPATPPPGLGASIRAAVEAEAVLRDRRRGRQKLSRSLVGVAAAVALLAVGAATGAAVTSDPAPLAAPSASPTQVGPYEPVSLISRAPGIVVTKAGVVPHTWGLELKFAGSGFTAGRTYRAVAYSADGSTAPAGEFLGTGSTPLTCNMQSALLRQDTTRVSVLDADGVTVLRADL